MRNVKNGTQNALIHRKLSEILIRECNDPRFKRVTISRVEAVRGLSMAHIYFSAYPPEQIEELTLSLNHAAGFFSNILGHALKTKNTPRLRFIYDKGFDYSGQIDMLLKQVSQEEIR